MLQFIVGVYYEEGPPVPIPNTVVKLFSAENTWREAAWENRSMPTLFKPLTSVRGFFLLFIDLIIFLLYSGYVLYFSFGENYDFSIFICYMYTSNYKMCTNSCLS